VAAPAQEVCLEDPAGIDYAAYSELAGPLTDPLTDNSQPYRVQYRTIHRTKREWLTVRILVTALVALDVRFMLWLTEPSHYPDLQGPLWLDSLKLSMMVGSIGMQVFLLLNVLTVCRACLAARDPIPVWPPDGLRVAFITTIVPSSEPIEMVRRTLEAARQIRYEGGPDSCFDVWLLDEGNLEEIRVMCAEIGVHHFSRRDIGGLKLSRGAFAKKTKHGNHNQWLWEHGNEYDIVMFVDPDHIPLANMAERMLGYFRDPDIAFVVGPQFYGNQDDRVTRWAESAQYLFHAVIQRAGNRYRCPMLVGTSAAVRISTLADMGGYVDSITEDLATSARIHATRNPQTGRKWRSVYTPDLTAVGEGPTSWTQFFGQQTRWSAGTYDALKRQYMHIVFRLPAGAMLHYSLMLTYYPSVAIGWIMGVFVSGCYLGFGITSLHAAANWWLLYYTDIAALQFLLYWFMRRHNVSPHEPEGSSGFSGMLISALTAPVYARSLVKVLLGMKLSFNVTAKGSSSKDDNIWTFRYHLMWAVPIVAILVMATFRSQYYPLMMGWAVLILGICLSPIIIWLCDSVRNSRRRQLPKHLHKFLGQQVQVTAQESAGT